MDNKRPLKKVLEIALGYMQRKESKWLCIGIQRAYTDGDLDESDVLRARLWVDWLINQRCFLADHLMLDKGWPEGAAYNLDLRIRWYQKRFKEIEE